MTQFNIKNNNSIDEKYQNGLLPQRNNKDLFYSQTSCRSNLNNFNLSSENRRILRKTENFSFQKISLKDFDYNFETQKKIKDWVRSQDWEFPVSSVKNIFTNHIFNYLYIWKNENNEIVAFSICYFSSQISHIAYVFYHPDYAHGNLPIRLVLQTIIDSQELGLKYCYLGRFSKENGYYKRNMPGFEYFNNNNWVTL
jgi:arginyl-tRNA--protein-N-Asp/Glu arginylyltransferase